MSPAPNDFKIGSLCYLLSYQRTRTLAALDGVTTSELDFEVIPNGNTIGMLLRHIACLWATRRIASIEKRSLTVAERGFWAGAFPGPAPFGPFGGRQLTFYTELLAAEYDAVLSYLRQMDDGWLYADCTPATNAKIKNFVAFYHLAEDECCHCGQIKMIRGLISRMGDKAGIRC